ncbi:hypothetical protein SAMN05880501_10929 [Ureibacillus xyleni]|uniref:Uncharacterized protein n=1 Tax=Ureibacillus xyleni TaxID=614648 RepID=A0A285T6B7_9BACL|nr:hypothetical protein [Ureibacillus xyleni]SOC16574.1 hypothetical protein SAMN05880501_10929 [Ureibacillus xyleni]
MSISILQNTKFDPSIPFSISSGFLETDINFSMERTSILSPSTNYISILKTVGFNPSMPFSLSNSPVICNNCSSFVTSPTYFENHIYCSEDCAKENLILVNKVSTLCKVTGLDPEEIKHTMTINQWTLDNFIENIDDSLEAISRGASIPVATASAFRNAGVFNTLSNNLSTYNTMRGGANGFKGFVFEELHAAKATVSGTPTSVLANNGVADFLIINSDGKQIFGQAKAGYQNTYIDFSKYSGQTIVVDKGNTQLIERAKSAGLQVIESDVSLKQSSRLADIMKLESQILRTSNANLTAKLYSLNQAGITAAKSGATFGAGFSIGSNIVEIFSGDKDLGEAGVDIVRDTAIATASSYVIGAAASTTIGTAVTGAVASTAVGSTVIAGVGTLTGAVTAGTTAVTSAIAGSTVGVGVASAATGLATAAASTAVGTAVTGAATAVAGTAVGGAAIAGAAAVGAAAVAAAPVVLGAAAVGGLVTLGRKIFGR